MPGQAGQFFREFGLTFAVAVLFSLVVARLLTPLMTAYLLQPLGGTNKAEERELAPRYAKALAWALGHLCPTAGLAAFLSIFALFLASQSPFGLFLPPPS